MAQQVFSSILKICTGAFFSLLLSLGISTSLVGQVAINFSFTGAQQSWTVPIGVTSIRVVAKGGGGGAGSNSASTKGGKLETDLSVSVGQVLNIFVGGGGSSDLAPNGGFNGGGSGKDDGGGGGGATDIRIGGTALTDRVLVAGGGGGSGDGHAVGGSGGGLTGQNGIGHDYTNEGGVGGSQSAGGAGGTTTYLNGGSGSLGTGGGGVFYAGGGGGGYYGGGGGGSSAGSWGSGGGGGSSYSLPTLCTNVTHTQGDNSGNGSLTISYCSPVVYVKANASGTNNGTSWTDAFTDLQSALAAACTGTQIWVAAGTYKPTSSTDRTISFVMKNGVEILGGFPNSGTPGLGDRNWTSNVTILSGDLSGNDVVTGSGNTLSITNNGENSYHVISNNGLDNTAVLDGFTIKGGNANGGYLYNIGGGMFNQSASPGVVHCTFLGNSAGSGGGMYNEGSSPSVTNCTFTGNSASYGGSGMYNFFSVSSVVNCTFFGNFDDGMSNSNASPSVTNCILWGNGSEVLNANASTPTITYSIVQGGYSGTGNLNLDPLFINAAGGDLRLMAASCAIDAGNNAAIPMGINTDLDGNPRRYNNGLVDMGAYEFRGARQPLAPPLTADNGLRFDGTNDYVEIVAANMANCTAAPFGGGDAITIEYWFKGSNIQSAVRFQNGSNFIVAGWGTAGNFQHILSNDGGINGIPVGAAATDGNWHHVAVTWQRNTTNGFKSYLDGELVAQRNAGNNPLPTITEGWLGAHKGAGEFINGALDEVRVWNVARTQAEIRQNLCGDLHLPQTGLVVYYQFNHGTAGGANAGINSLTNSADAGQYMGMLNMGILRNFSLSGAASNWVAPKSASSIRYVKQGGTGDGSSWANASGNLQAMINAPCAEQVWVAAGTYKPTDGTDRTISFVLKNGVQILGGFPNTGNPGLSDRNWTSNVTILSGDLSGNDGANFANNGENSYHVIFNNNNGLNSTAVLDGFTIKGGNGNGSDINNTRSGGGMMNISSSPSVINCAFIENGGGNGNGGGMYNRSSSPVVTNCSFSGNVAGFGGGMNNNDSAPGVTNCIFTGNSAISAGGGMDNFNSAPSATNCVFSGNSAGQGGGGMYNFSSAPGVTNCIFSGNSATFGGGMYNSESSPGVTNCILWGNGREISNVVSSPTVSYSIVQGGYGGTGNLDLDPLFVNAAGGDLHLQACSPAIDAGSDAANSSSTDLGGNARKFEAITGGQKIDMGAYEYQQTAPMPTALCKTTYTAVLNTTNVSVTPANINNGSVDNNCGAVTLSINGQSSIAYTCSDIGQHTVTLSVYAAQSNRTSTCQTTVTVADNTPPTAVCQNISVNLSGSSASITAGQVLNAGASSDNCGTVSAQSVSPNSFGCTNTGPNTVTLTANDGKGNSATCTAIVTVSDNTPPTVVCQNITVNLSGSSASITASQVLNTTLSTDNCGTVNAQSVTPNSFTCANTASPNTVTLTANDGKGNTATCTAIVTVVDNTPPTVVCQNIMANLNGNSAGITASQVLNAALSGDNCGAVTPASVTPSSFTCINVGINVVTLTANDGKGNTATCTATVTVKDIAPPSVTCPANIIRANDANQCGAVVTYAQPVAADNCGSPTLNLLSAPGTASGSTFPVGATTVQWAATDGGGVSATCAFTVTVADSQAPNIACPANQAVGTDPNQCYATVFFAAPTGSDNCALPSNAVAQTSGPASGAAFPKGTSTVVFKVTDAAGLTKTCSFRVIVSDAQNPAIVCPGAVSVPAGAEQCGAVVTYATPTATDNCTSAPTVTRIGGTASGGTVAVGSSVAIWRAIDGAGRSSTCSIGITVTDNQAPEIACPDNIAQTNPPNACNAPVFYPTPTATDNCGVNGLFLAEGMASGSSFPVGVTSVVWRAVDNNGLSATCSFRVTVSCGTYRPLGDVVQRSPALHTSAPNGVRRCVLSPNPAVEMVDISWDGGAPEHVAVFDAQGKLIWEQGVDTLARALFVDVSEWAAGVYMVALRAKETVEVKRLVVGE